MCRKKNHQGSRFIIESVKGFPQKVMKVTRSLRKKRESDKVMAVKRRKVAKWYKVGTPTK